MNSTSIPDLYYGYRHHLPFAWTDVLRMEGIRNYTMFVLIDGQRYMSARTLCVYEPHLPVGFVRVHKCCIINRAYIQTCHHATKTLTLSDGTVVKAARRRWGETLKSLL